MTRRLLASLLLTTVAAPASAGVITTTFDRAASTLHSARMSLNSGASWQSVAAGRMAFRVVTASEAGFDAGDLFYAFCIEPFEYVGGTTTYNVASLADGTTFIGGMGATKARLVSQLMARFRPEIGGSISGLDAAALQFAIWEVVAENSGSFSLAAGSARFQSMTDAGAVTLGQSYLDALTPGGPTHARLRAIIKRGAQDQLIEVPEPGMIGLLGLGLAGIAVGRRRRAR